MNKETQLWYLKVKGQVKGPFATGLISKNILLGRIHPNDLLSQDKEIWRKASSVREVMPDVIKHRNEPNYKERLKAARRWADEREQVREVGADGKAKIFATRKKITHLRIKTLGFIGILSFVAIISGLVITLFLFTPEDPLAKIDCNATQGEGRIFDGCHLQRKNFTKKSLKNSSFKNTLLQNTQFSYAILQNSNFDYANLSHATLSHANFTQASLRAVDLRSALLYKTNFSNADLSYADLTGAKVSKINLTGAILNNTVWFDGNICNKASIGKCIK